MVDAGITCVSTLFGMLFITLKFQVHAPCTTLQTDRAEWLEELEGGG